MTSTAARRGQANTVRARPVEYMPPAVSALASRLPSTDGHSRQSVLRGVLIALPHLVALAILLATEDDFVAQVAFALAWGVLNCFWLALFRRPGFAGGVSLTLVVLLVLLSQLKHGVLFMTVNFVDLMIIDWDTIGFLLTVMPTLSRNVLIAALVTLPAAVAIWWLDPLRVRRRAAALGFVGCLAALTALAFAAPSNSEAEFYGSQYVSKF